MNWSDLGHKVADIAPALGTVLGGPAGSAVGSIVASIFGSKPNPGDIAAAISADPQAAMKLRQIEIEHQSEITKMVLADAADQREKRQVNMQDINATMRAELVAKSGYRAGWRPMIGYVVALSIGGICSGLVYAMFTHPEQAAQIVQSSTVVLSIALGVLGYNVRQRSKDKETAAGISPEGIIQQLLHKDKR